MTEIEQLRADLATLEAAAKVPGMRAIANYVHHLEATIERDTLAYGKLAAQAADLLKERNEARAELAKRPVLESPDALLQEMERHKGSDKSVEVVVNDLRTLKTARQILATYKHLHEHDYETDAEINALIKSLDKFAGSQAMPYRFEPAPDTYPLNLDHLREKLAELTTIYNAIPPACPDAQALVQARIDSVKKEMQESEAAGE